MRNKITQKRKTKNKTKPTNKDVRILNTRGGPSPQLSRTTISTLVFSELKETGIMKD